MTLYTITVSDDLTGMRTALALTQEQLDYATEPDLRVRRACIKTAACHLKMIARRLEKLAAKDK